MKVLPRPQCPNKAKEFSPDVASITRESARDTIECSLEGASIEGSFSRWEIAIGATRFEPDIEYGRSDLLVLTDIYLSLWISRRY